MRNTLPTWRQLHPDEDPIVEAIQFQRFRDASGVEKFDMFARLNADARRLALAGLRRRYVGASDAFLRQKLAEHLLGREISAKTFLEMRDNLGPIDVLLHVTRALEALNVEYAVGGSMASILYGIVRTTNDANVIADFGTEHVERLVQILLEDFYADATMIRDALRRRSSFNIIHATTAFKVDVFIPKQRPFDRLQLQRRVRETVGSAGRELYVVTPEDIILAKLDWAKQSASERGEISERQWRDVLGVVKTQAEALDLEYLRRTARTLGVTPLLEQALDEVK